MVVPPVVAYDSREYYKACGGSVTILERRKVYKEKGFRAITKNKMANQEYGFKEIKEDLDKLKRRPYSVRRTGLYWMVFSTTMLSIGNTAHNHIEDKRHQEVIQKQNELETICKNSGQWHIKNVTGGAGEDVYLEADGKRFYLSIDGKTVTNGFQEK